LPPIPGVYSQFSPVEFQIDGVGYRWAEQWMMAAKARLFGDREALTAILGANDPLTCKKIGRTVRNYDDGAWSAARFDLVVAGNIAKFNQKPAAARTLLGSGDAILVEAARATRSGESVSVAKLLRCMIPNGGVGAIF
jgi:ribA/ribD-fused uncharacterized protein